MRVEARKREEVRGSRGDCGQVDSYCSLLMAQQVEEKGEER